jgi:hypothetical protein
MQTWLWEEMETGGTALLITDRTLYGTIFTLDILRTRQELIGMSNSRTLHLLFKIILAQAISGQINSGSHSRMSDIVSGKVNMLLLMLFLEKELSKLDQTTQIQMMLSTMPLVFRSSGPLDLKLIGCQLPH